MKKRFLAVLLILALVLAPTALAAGEKVQIYTKDGPVWLARRESMEKWELVYSADKGKTWTATGMDSTGISVQDIQYTGRDYFLTGYWCKMAYTSVDGASWTYLSDLDWFIENASYITNGHCGGEYQMLWTGSEYMMRQSIKGDPRSTHNRRDPNPRNKLVTILDENYNILSSMAFDGEVESIRYKDGTYYATVGGVEHSFTRADWENNFEGPGIIRTDFYCDGTVILRREVNGRFMGRISNSYDGAAWQILPTQGESEDGLSYSISVGKNTNASMVQTGRGFFNIASNPADCRATVDGIHWFSVGERDWVQEAAKGWTNLSAQGSQSFQFVWTGKEYMMRQNVGYGPPEARYESPGNTKVTFLDENYNMVKQYEFGRPVEDIGYLDGIYYAKVETVDLDSGYHNRTVFTSVEGDNWTKTALEDIPQATAAKEAPAEGDVTAGKYILRLEKDGRLLVSDDGVYAALVGNIPAYQDIAPIPYTLTAAYAGRDGILLCLAAMVGDENKVLSSKNVSYTKAALDGMIVEAFPENRYYVTLNGEYIPFDDPPYGKNDRTMVPLRNISEALGFTVDYDDKGASCTKGDTVITVEFGTDNATVNGEAFTLEAGVEVYHDRTYVPLRFFSEQMGLDVSWDAEKGTAVLTTK